MLGPEAGEASDEDKLDGLLEASDRLEEQELAAFTGMRDRVRSGKQLTDRQRQWVDTKLKFLRIHVNTAEHLHSSGKVKLGAPTPAIDRWLTENKPLKPPGRR